MTHPDEGTIVALRDGEPIAENDRAHIAACSTCSILLTEAHARAEVVARMFEEEAGEIDIARAKRAVRDRLDRERSRSSSWMFATGLRRAAAVLLVAAGAVSALPSSPVRAWISGAADEVAPGPPDRAVGTSLREEVRSIGVPARAGLVIALTGAEPGTSVSFVFESRDAVEVSAGEGTRFAIAPARVEASEVVGPVVIRVPADARRSHGDPGRTYDVQWHEVAA